MARTAATPTSRLESQFRKAVGDFQAMQRLASRGKVTTEDLVSEATELRNQAVSNYKAGHGPFREHAAEWTANVASLTWLSKNPPVKTAETAEPESE